MYFQEYHYTRAVNSTYLQLETGQVEQPSAEAVMWEQQEHLLEQFIDICQIGVFKSQHLQDECSKGGHCADEHIDARQSYKC